MPHTPNHALHRYFHQNGSSTSSGNAPYALVTGSTGGMGEEWALQLADLGFNLIIQGRSSSKLEKVKQSILSRSPNCSVILLVTEATIYPNPKLTESLTKILKDEDVRLTIVINNLGVVSEGYPRLEDETTEELAQVIIANTFFPAEVTRVTISFLKRFEPSLLVTVTSMGFKAPPPYLSPYIGTKGFDVSFSRSVYNEMAVEKAQVDVVCMAPGQVVSGMNSGPPTIMIPSSEHWVQAAIASLRSTWWTPRPSNFIVPWRPHAIGQFFSDNMPQFITDKIATSMVVEMKRKFIEEGKKN